MSYYVDSPLTLWILNLSFFPEEVQVVYLKIERQTRVDWQVILASSIHRQPKPGALERVMPAIFLIWKSQNKLFIKIALKHYRTLKG